MNDERPDLGRAPAWAKHLHDCMHEVKTQQQSDRHAAANRDMILQATMDQILLRLGKESDDGEGGTGLVGEVRRTSSRVSGLTAERNMVRGVILTLTMVGALLVANLKAWVQGIIGGGS